MRGIGGHHRPNEGKSNDWLTPPDLVRALGPFDLDPCASVGQPWRTAQEMWTERGLDRTWPSVFFVWCNPPYGPHVWKWLDRLAFQGNGIGLIFARTETDGFFKTVWEKASALYFLRGRLHFHHPVTGKRAAFNSGAPSVLVGYGQLAHQRLQGLNQTEFSGRCVPLA